MFILAQTFGELRERSKTIRSTGCTTCVKEAGCGWCDARQTCLPGNATETSLGQCDRWFFRACVTSGPSGGCSSQVSIIDCKGRFCNKELSYANKGTCQRCKDVEHSYSNKSDTSACSTWNETRCPNGVVTPDYDDPRRIENTVFSEKKLGAYSINSTALATCRY